jgi:hypothetical protein
MPRADEYASAAEVCDVQAHRWRLMEHDELSQRQALAARCVRAMAALASGEVMLVKAEDLWRAWVRGGASTGVSADPLDAIAAALGGDDA